MARSMADGGGIMESPQGTVCGGLRAVGRKLDQLKLGNELTAWRIPIDKRLGRI